MKPEPRLKSLGGVLSWFRRRTQVSTSERVNTRVVTNIRVTNPWHAVAVSGGPSCCRASFLARSQRYLSTEAPPLPLAGCTQPKSCLCKYKHFSDRRAGPRRTTDSNLYKNALSPHRIPRLTFQDRRGSKGRRADDGR
ncbi:MAG TPA: hypothetical protein VNZ06_10615 [Steroidobacteraceae bacterium]|jgi:hypothetical protein|nr:hypothetical protein [Steroidobacteraceae bacterium]